VSNLITVISFSPLFEVCSVRMPQREQAKLRQNRESKNGQVEVCTSLGWYGDEHVGGSEQNFGTCLGCGGDVRVTCCPPVKDTIVCSPTDRFWKHTIIRCDRSQHTAILPGRPQTIDELVELANKCYEQQASRLAPLFWSSRLYPV